jgi:alpha-galactosidase
MTPTWGSPERIAEPCYRSAKLILVAVFAFLLSDFAKAEDVSIRNQQLSATVRSQDGSYEIRTVGLDQPVIRARVAAEINHRWVKSTDYPKHETSQSGFEDALGRGRQLTVTFTGLAHHPDLVYMLRLYDALPFGDIEVEVRNGTEGAVTVQSIRSAEAMGERPIYLGGSESADRILSDSFSEDWPAMQIYDLGQAPQGLHRGAGSQLIYNRESKQSVFFGAVTSRRFLTILRLQAQGETTQSRITSFNVDSTGTTEIQVSVPDTDMRDSPTEDKINLSLPLARGKNMTSERLMFAAGNDYHSQLEAYGAAIRQLHYARISEDSIMGWWSWTSNYMDITEGKLLTNAQWLAGHLKALGFDFFHLDEGSGYAHGEYDTPDAAKFPNGVRSVAHEICRLGFKLGIWTSPFQVGNRSWVYEHHKDWLVHNAKGQPIRVVRASESDEGESIFVLDTTHPGAQEYLRKTYRTFAREWGIRYIKLDFMERTAIEGYFYQPNTTALEAQRIGLSIIRKSVGDDVLLDKDGSPMLNPVGLVDEGRTSTDSGHQFSDTKRAAPGNIARYYMHRNFFVNDSDAFNVQREVPPGEDEGRSLPPLTLNEAQVSIVLAAVSGGMYELGDDLPTLGSEPERLALVTNANLLQMAKLGRVSKPLDLLTYRPEDELPSVMFLREDDRQYMLAVFNWTEQPRSHSFKRCDLNLPSGHPYQLYDALSEDQSIPFVGETILLNDQPAHSVRLLKIIDSSVPPAPPTITAQAPSHAKIGEEVKFSASAAESGVPALAYHWDFGDGVTADGRALTHTFTFAGTHTVRLTADGVDGVSEQKTLTIAVDGQLKIKPPRRYAEPN